MDTWLNTLSPREWAALTWIAIALAAGFWHPEFRKGLIEILQAFFVPAILTTLGIAAAYIALCVWVMAERGMWTAENLKTTMIWAASFAFVTMMDRARSKNEPDFFRQTIKETIGLTTALTFIAEFYSFPYLVEFVALPFLTFLGIMHMFAQLKHKDQTVERLLGCIVGLIGWGYLGYASYLTILNPDGFFTLDTMREFLTPVVLSALFLPFLYLMGVWFNYERVFSILPLWIPDAALRRRAKWRSFWRFGLKLKSLDRWRHIVVMDRPTDSAHLERTFAEVRGMEKRDSNPPAVMPDDGWSPQAAIKFLKDHNLDTLGYKRLYDDEWHASLPLFELGDPGGLWRNNIGYYVSGNTDAATKLTLKLNLNCPDEYRMAEERFVAAVRTLIEAALGPGTAEMLKGEIAALRPFSKSLPNGVITLEKGDGIIPVKGSYSRKLIIARAQS